MTTHKGKILIIRLDNRLLAILLRGNQILSVRVLKPTEFAVGNIYVARVQSISENIGAAFLDLGGGCLTFLPLAEAAHAILTNRISDGSLKAGDELPVQIVKDSIKNKLAGVTTKLSLSGQYAVVGIKPKGQKDGVQVSSKLDAAKQSHFRGVEELEQISRRFRLIVRTNAGTLDLEEPLLEEALYRSRPDYVSFVENAYRSEYDEVVTDLPEVYDILSETCRKADIPLRLYADALLPLYKLYSVEQRLQELSDRKVWLKSGGYLVIEPTEALVSIDVNTGKYENGKNREETFYRINREAAEMIALHLRARNLSGIILVDFINLKSREREQSLLEYMRCLLKQDPIPARALDMTALGLMELTRKKVAPSLAEQLRNP